MVVGLRAGCAAGEVAELLAGVTEGSARESESLQVVERAVSALDEVTRGNVSSAEELAASVAATREDVQSLPTAIQRFRVAASWLRCVPCLPIASGCR